MAKQLTVRGIPDEVQRQIEALSRATGRSVNATVVKLLEDAVSADSRRRYIERRYATWTPADLSEFEAGLAGQREIDDAIWS